MGRTFHNVRRQHFGGIGNRSHYFGVEMKLTKRQKQIMVFLDRGMTNEEIARELDICPPTVNVHMWRLCKKIGVKNRLAAASWWRKDQQTETVNVFLLNAAFYAACRMADKVKDPALVAEFNFHREQIEKDIK